MHRDIVTNGASNIILAEGRSRGFWGTWKAAALGVLAGFAILFGWFVWQLSQPLPLPEGTVFYAVATSKDADALPASVHAGLPQDWASAIDTRSAWPVIVGLYQNDEGTFSFVTTPWWKPPQTEKTFRHTSGFASTLTDTDVPVVSGPSYGWYVFTAWRAKSITLSVRADRLVGASPDDQPTWITATVRDDLLVSDLPVGEAPDRSLASGDVSWHMPPGGTEFLKRSEPLPYLPPTDRLHRLPDLTRVDVWLETSTQPLVTRLEFERPLTEDEAGILLGAYGFTVRRLVRLPDGSTAFEHVEPAPANGASLFGQTVDESGRVADISGAMFTLTSTGTQLGLTEAAPCLGHRPWMRLSDRIVSILAERIGLNGGTSGIRPAQIISYRGRLALCFE